MEEYDYRNGRLAGQAGAAVTRPPRARVRAIPAEADALRSFPPSSPATLHHARALLAHLFGPVASRSFAVRFWDGSVDAPTGTAPVFELVLPRPSSLRNMFTPPVERRLGEAFVRGDFDVTGDLEAATRLADVVQRRVTPDALGDLVSHLLALPRGHARPRPAERALARRGRRHTPSRDAAAIRSHYDIGNDFYELFLDRRMVYSCAYFETGTEDIDTAQEAKLDLICRKLRLAPDEPLLDIGCGWGGLVQYAAEHYRCRVLGVTLSQAQADYATGRIAHAGLGDRAAIRCVDYRSIEPPEQFRKIVSVGMFEHVGRDHLPEYFAKVYALLKPGGLFLNHGIVTHPIGAPALRAEPGISTTLRRVLWGSGEFIDRYVFPDGELAMMREVIGAAEAVGFEVRDVESLREHYVRTLRRWGERLQRAEDPARQIVGGETYRTWRLYMAASAHAFASRRIGITQTLFAKPDESGRVSLPLTRADIYRSSIADRR